MSVNHQGATKPLDYIANVFRRRCGHLPTISEVFDKVVHIIIINARQSVDISNFLQMYEDVCLQHKLKAHLHIVIFTIIKSCLEYLSS